MRRIDRPMASARVHWLPEVQGGRQAPPPGPTYASTAVFVLGGDAELVPGRPEGGEHFSVMIEFERLDSRGECLAKVEFMSRDLVGDRLAVGARFLVMEGRKRVAEACVVEVFED